MEDDFYASIKLISGEEVFAKVAACDEDDRTMLLLHHPIIIKEIKEMRHLGLREPSHIFAGKGIVWLMRSWKWQVRSAI